MNDGYTRDPKRVEQALREKGVVVVMGRDHAKTPQHVINTVQGIYEAGLIAEVTFRIPEGDLERGHDRAPQAARGQHENPPRRPHGPGRGQCHQSPRAGDGHPDGFRHDRGARLGDGGLPRAD